MSIQIYYFSGTGNSLIVAKDIAERTGAELIPITSVRDRETVAVNADAVGVVFPVYYAYLPVIVREFAEKLTGLQNKYVFAVCTHGGAAMGSLRTLKSILRKNGVRLLAAYGVHMPQNAFLKPGEDREKALAAWNRKLDMIVKNTSRRAKGFYYNNRLLELLIIPFLPIVKSACRNSFVKQTKLSADTPMDELVRNLDRGFAVNDDCSGCGVCASVCPAQNIGMRDGRPQWLHRCENCLACVNWCPSRAIQGGIASGYFYRNPRVKASDIARQSISVDKQAKESDCDA